jgi:hypothetical protein
MIALADEVAESHVEGAFDLVGDDHRRFRLLGVAF